MRPPMQPQMRPEMRPALSPVRPPGQFYAPPRPPFVQPPYLPYGRPAGVNGWAGADNGPTAWDIGVAQDNFNQAIAELQQEHNEGVVALQQQFNAGQISRDQMDFGIEELGRRYDEAVAYQQQLLLR